MQTPLDELRDTVEAAAAALGNGHVKAAPTLERPKKAGFGDYSTNAAMLLAPVLKAPPRDVAERLGDELRGRLSDRLARFEVAGPGFLNLWLGDAWFRDALQHILDAGAAFGSGGAPLAEHINVEFVSANPTGPMHVGHARNAAYGDALARLLAFEGHDVAREFYANDYGTQVRKFGESIRARARGEEVPDDGYRGAYVAEVAAQIEGAAELDPDDLGRRGVEAMLAQMRVSLHAFGVDFDVWFSERSLHVSHAPDPDPVRHALAVLEEQQGQVYRSEGALWLRTSELGDDKDRVLERSSGDHTYFASDIAYLLNKRERGFERLILTLGADHHGYVQRMRAAYQALGNDLDTLELLIMQFVHLAGGQSMSKRAGEFVTLDDLVSEIGVDAARWFLLARSHDTTIELDLDLARQESAENPVYYVQYAHARIASLLRKAGDEAAPEVRAVDLEDAERALIKKLLAFPGEAREAAERRAPHRVATYALELAREFTAFYEACPVLKAPTEDQRALRLALSLAAQRTLARALDLLGVAAPDSM